MPLVQALPREQRRVVMLWLTRQGPFWEDDAGHDPNEYFECKGEVVTEAALAEAAYCSTIGVDRRMVSFTPSSWEYSPIKVKWKHTDTNFTPIDVKNYWDETILEADLREVEPPLQSWRELEQRCRRRFQSLNFVADCFSYLNGRPFAPGPADHIVRRLEVLDRLQSVGRGSVEGRRLYENHFMGDRAWFSDSSDTEKRRFRRQMTFQSPEPGGDPMFCTWHGKINHPTYRIHFTWPVPPGDKLYVVYVGYKITLG